MTSHLVLLAVKAELTPAERSAFIASFKTALASIPTVRGVRVGRRVVHGAAYESLPSPAIEFVAVIDFDDLAGLQAYLRHPAHEELGMLFYRAADAAAVYDFEMAGIEALSEFLDG